MPSSSWTLVIPPLQGSIRNDAWYSSGPILCVPRSETPPPWVFAYTVRFSPIGQNPNCCEANAAGVWGVVAFPATQPDEFTSSRNEDGDSMDVPVGRYARLPRIMLYDHRGMVAFASKTVPFREFGTEPSVSLTKTGEKVKFPERDVPPAVIETKGGTRLVWFRTTLILPSPLMVIVWFVG